MQELRIADRIVRGSVDCQLLTHYADDTLKLEWLELLDVREAFKDAFRFADPQVQRSGDKKVVGVTFEKGLFSDGTKRIVIEECRFEEDKLYLKGRGTTRELQEVRDRIYSILEMKIGLTPGLLQGSRVFDDYASLCRVKMPFSLDDLLIPAFARFLQTSWREQASYERDPGQFTREVATIAVTAVLELLPAVPLSRDVIRRAKLKNLHLTYEGREDRSKGILSVFSELSYDAHLGLLEQMEAALSGTRQSKAE